MSAPLQRAIQRRHFPQAEMAAREIGQLSLIDALALVACCARTGHPKFEQAAVRWLVRLADERDQSLRDVRLAAAALEALQTKASRSGREDAASVLDLTSARQGMTV
jgi:hypothetical protein